jgi:CRISPR-associated protein Cas1
MTTDARRRLAKPTLAMLPRVADSLSFLYIDVVRIVQDDTGVCAEVQTRDGTGRVYLPTAAVSCVLLGPGTSITHRALSTIARHGTSVVCVGSGGVRCYAGILPDSLTTAWLERQARAWADDASRLALATRMYERRFNEPVTPGTTLAQLRGLEGQRMKAMYRLLAERHGTGKFRRNYDPAKWNEQDAVNLALSAANACLYGVVHAVILALGCSPALGFVHTGTQHAFVYDIADLYKASLTLPIAFSLHTSSNPERDARLRLRQEFRLLKLMPKIVTDLQWLLDPTAGRVEPEPQVDIVNLWDPDAGELPAGVNYGSDPW